MTAIRRAMNSPRQGPLDEGQLALLAQMMQLTDMEAAARGEWRFGEPEREALRQGAAVIRRAMTQKLGTCSKKARDEKGVIVHDQDVDWAWVRLAWAAWCLVMSGKLDLVDVGGDGK